MIRRPAIKSQSPDPPLHCAQLASIHSRHRLALLNVVSTQVNWKITHGIYHLEFWNAYLQASIDEVARAESSIVWVNTGYLSILAGAHREQVEHG